MLRPCACLARRLSFRLHTWLLIAGLACHAGGAACAGDDAATAPQGPQVRSAAISLGVYAPGRWADTRVSITNPEDAPADVLCTTQFHQDPNLQFGRRVRVPANARLSLSLPLLVPTAPPPDERMQSLKTFLVRAGAEEDVLLPQLGGALYADFMMRTDDREPLVGVVDRRDDPQPGEYPLADFVKFARETSGLKQSPMYLPDPLLPASALGLDALDQLVLGDDRALDDPAGLAAVRDWMMGGGRLWVMLDRVDPRLVERLLGDEFACQVVDEVGLNHVHFTSDRQGLMSPGDGSDHEWPVRQVRVVASGFDVLYSVDGWPAAMTRNCGDGLLLVTTVAKEGWLRPKRPGQYEAPFKIPERDPDIALVGLASLMFPPRAPAPLATEVAEDHLRGYVGYSIPSRRLVLGLLAGFSVLLAFGGIALARAGRLEWLGVAGLVGAVLISGALVSAGNRQRSVLPATTAFVQYVQPLQGTETVVARGTAGLFSPTADTSNWSGNTSGVLFPDMAGQEESIRRLVWTDGDRWQWEHLQASPGLRFAAYTGSQRFANPPVARLSLDEQGVVGQWTLPDGLVPSDGLLATRMGRLAVTFSAEGRLTAPATSTLSADEYLAAGVLSDEQHRRLETLRRLMADPAAWPFPDPLMLLFWTPPWPMGVESSPPTEPAGSALVALPVVIEPPAAGTAVTIPAPWLTFHEATGPDGLRPTGLFDNRRLVFSEKARPTTSWLRFQVPRSLLPLDLRAGTLRIDVRGPVGRLEVESYSAGQRVPVAEWVDPIGALRFEITDPSQLSVDESGGVFLKISGGDPDRPELANTDPETGAALSYWQIEHLALELRAVVGERRLPDAADP